MKINFIDETSFEEKLSELRRIWEFLKYIVKNNRNGEKMEFEPALSKWSCGSIYEFEGSFTTESSCIRPIMTIKLPLNNTNFKNFI